jgi:hypothetical protein
MWPERGSADSPWEWASTVTVRTPEAARLRDLLLAPDITVTNVQPDVLQVDGLTAEQIGTVARQARVPIYELAVQQASLEQVFMTLTSDSVEYRQPLRDPQFFVQAYVDPKTRTVAWPGGIDLDPEGLHEEAGRHPVKVDRPPVSRLAS